MVPKDQYAVVIMSAIAASYAKVCVQASLNQQTSVPSSMSRVQHKKCFCVSYFMCLQRFIHCLQRLVGGLFFIADLVGVSVDLL